MPGGNGANRKMPAHSAVEPVECVNDGDECCGPRTAVDTPRYNDDDIN